MGTRCEECGENRPTRTSPTGRHLCDDCFARLTGMTAAGVALASGEGAPAAVGSAIAAGGFSGSMDTEARHRAEQREKLAVTEGFWRRLKVRIVG